MTDEQLVEKVAKEICRRQGSKIWQFYIPNATNAIEAIQEEHVIVGKDELEEKTAEAFTRGLLSSK